MKSHVEWAVVVTVLNDMTIDDHSSTDALDPAAQLQRITRNRITHQGSTLHYSEKVPHLSLEDAASDLRPIDGLYGSYDPSTRKIEIYFKAIDRDKKLYDATFEDLLHVVSLHEFAHAIVHLGIRVERSDGTLFFMNDAGTTDWELFLAERLSAFGKIGTPSHEFLAQALTYAAILSLDERHRERLRKVFHRLEAHQPPHYRLLPGTLPFIGEAKWDIILDAARGDIDTAREVDFNLRTGLEELVCFTGGRQPAEDEPAKEWIAKVDDDLVASLKQVLNAEEPRSSLGDEYTELLVDKYGGLRIEIFAREHPPPHFRVLCGSETANYRIEDCKQLNGGLRVHNRAIRRWHDENKTKLIEAWNRHRPSDCPVGEFRSSV